MTVERRTPSSAGRPAFGIDPWCCTADEGVRGFISRTVAHTLLHK